MDGPLGEGKSMEAPFQSFTIYLQGSMGSFVAPSLNGSVMTIKHMHFHNERSNKKVNYVSVDYNVQVFYKAFKYIQTQYNSNNICGQSVTT